MDLTRAVLLVAIGLVAAKTSTETQGGSRELQGGSRELQADSRELQADSRELQAGNRIVGGKEAKVGEFPWMVYVKIDRKFCGGTIINSQFVLTAGHCILDGSGNVARSSDIRVFTERHDISKTPGDPHAVLKHYVHPRFQEKSLVNDIAILQLEDNLAFTNSLYAVNLPKQSLQMSEGTVVVATGWGKLANRDQWGSKTLQKVSLPLITISRCKGLYKDVRKPVISSNLCTLDLNGKDACVGDSGGPLLLWNRNKYVQVGITSWGRSCADPRYPGVWTSVAHYVSWIKRITEQSGRTSKSETETTPSSGSSEVTMESKIMPHNAASSRARSYSLALTVLLLLSFLNNK